MYFTTQFLFAASCPVGTFGYLCSYMCHCAFDTPCDPDTGACFGECKPGFAGKPYCQLGKLYMKLTEKQDYEKIKYGTQTMFKIV